jgi:hypothetical protein
MHSGLKIRDPFLLVGAQLLKCRAATAFRIFCHTPAKPEIEGPEGYDAYVERQQQLELVLVGLDHVAARCVRKQNEILVNVLGYVGPEAGNSVYALLHVDFLGLVGILESQT